MEMIKIFLTEDHDLVRDGIKALLSGITDIQIIGEASSGKSLFDQLQSIQPDVLVLDISLPDISGIEITKKISLEYPGIRVLILSMYTHEDFIFNSLKAGAIGYLPKNTTRDELVKAIYTVSRGEEFFGDQISKILVNSYIRTSKNQEPEDRKLMTLTARELEILRLIVEGFVNKEIQATLGISIRTVETHKNHIMKKLGCKSLVEVVKLAIRNKIIKM